MSQEITVPVSLLRATAQSLLDHLEEVQGDTVSLTHDFFWAIPQEQLYDPYVSPSDLTLGQLTESIANLQRIADDTDLEVSYALVWLADVLRAVGQSVVR